LGGGGGVLGGGGGGCFVIRVYPRPPVTKSLKMGIGCAAHSVWRLRSPLLPKGVVGVSG